MFIIRGPRSRRRTASSTEVLPAAGFERARAGGCQQSHGGAATARANDAADVGERDACDACRDAPAGWCREEQFVVFAAVEGLIEGGTWAERDGC